MNKLETKIIRLRRDGLSNSRIAKKLNYTLGYIDQICMKLVGQGRLEKRKAGRGIDPAVVERKKRILKLRKKGFSYSQIGEKVGLSEVTVKMFFYHRKKRKKERDMNIKVQAVSTTFAVNCPDCGKRWEVVAKSEHEAERKVQDDLGWKYGNGNYICPTCHQKYLEKMAKSDDLYEQITGGVFETKLPWGKTKEEKEAYQEDRAKLEDKFRTAALKYCGIDKHPKASMAYSKAWERSHSEGLASVLSSLEDYAELMK